MPHPTIQSSQFSSVRLLTIVIFFICALRLVSAQQPTRFDEWGRLPIRDEQARLDNLAIFLQTIEPAFVAYLMLYAGKHSCFGQIQAHAIRAKNYLVKRRGINADRIIWKDAGYREKFTVEIWTWPRNLGEPAASPSLSSRDARVVHCNPRHRIRRKRNST